MIDPKTVPSFKLNDGGVIPCVGMGTFGSDRVTPEEVAGAVAFLFREEAAYITRQVISVNGGLC